MFAKIEKNSIETIFCSSKLRSQEAMLRYNVTKMSLCIVFVYWALHNYDLHKVEN